MHFTQLDIEGVWLIEPKRIGDSRGYFLECFKREIFESKIGAVDFVQENESKSSFGVIRGLHFQKGEFAQAKLVRAVVGRVLDVIVDLRENSPSFGKQITIELSDENAKQVFIPRGCAHGFAVLSSEAIFAYKVDNVYAPDQEQTLKYNDSKLNIDWRIDESERILSSKDLSGLSFEECYRF
ncbi:MAG: dTDP-4-dehydrorhamnose 3,5-epimerase [Bacteroidales bacterium]